MGVADDCKDPDCILTHATVRKAADHQHQFTIPVEWTYDYGVEFEGVLLHNNELRSKKVTKLRCPCGTEIER